MDTYPSDHWRLLGRLVFSARTRAGYTDTQRWSEAVGRSSRMVLGLERGEAVGKGTLDRVAAVLDWHPGVPYAVLSTGRAEVLEDAPPRSVGSVSAGNDDAPSQWLTRTRSDLTDEEMEELWQQSEQVLEALKAQVLARRTRGSTLGNTRGNDTQSGSSS